MTKSTPRGKIGMDSGLALALLDLAIAVGEWRLTVGKPLWVRIGAEKKIVRAFERV